MGHPGSIKDLGEGINAYNGNQRVASDVSTTIVIFLMSELFGRGRT